MERFNFREYIDLVESHQIINEGQADVMYKQMIDSVKKVIDSDPEKFETKNVTSWFNTTLPQTWESLTGSDTFKQLSNPWKIYITRMFISNVNSRLKEWFPNEFKNKKVAYPNTKVRFPDMMERLKHLSGINYPKLKLYSPPQNKTPEQVIDDLDDLEQEYIDSTGDNMITPDGSEEVIKDFGDVAWFDLGRGSCEIEGDAMGHCGNVPSERAGDRVLSLRKKEMVNGIELHRSILTFIFNNGYLGEMKGRGNEKPAKRYHRYIVELLKLPMIEGILGGGYLAESNFSLSDLSPELLEEGSGKQKAKIL